MAQSRNSPLYSSYATICHLAHPDGRWLPPVSRRICRTPLRSNYQLNLLLQICAAFSAPLGRLGPSTLRRAAVRAAAAHLSTMQQQMVASSCRAQQHPQRQASVRQPSVLAACRLPGERLAHLSSGGPPFEGNAQGLLHRGAMGISGSCRHLLPLPAVAGDNPATRPAF